MGIPTTVPAPGARVAPGHGSPPDPGDAVQPYAELRQVQAELVARAAREAVDHERSRLARELHDSVTQMLFSAGLVAQSLPQLCERDPAQAQQASAEVVRLTRGALAEMRTLLRELRPQAVVDTDLGTLISQLAEGLGARHGLVTHVTATLSRPVPPDVHVAAYRVAQEAITNVARHAAATTLSVSIDGRGGSMHLRVADDGTGFDCSAPHCGMGLANMRERSAEVGAGFGVRSDVGGGTVVRFDWPAEASDRARREGREA